jgi:hypothetical protein
MQTVLSSSGDAIGATLFCPHYQSLVTEALFTSSNWGALLSKVRAQQKTALLPDIHKAYTV